MPLPSITQSACVVVLGLLATTLWTLVPFLVRIFKPDPLRDLPGPPSDHWLWGNFKALEEEENSAPQERWMKQYGSHSIIYRGLFRTRRLWTTDTRAVNHILTHSAEFQKSGEVRRSLAKILGEGVLFTEAEQHRQQRRVMNPAFGPSQIRELTSIFVDKSIELRNVWSAEIAKAGEPARIDVMSWFSRMTLDIIGLAGFNYHFDNISGKPNELLAAFREIFNPHGTMTTLMILRNLFPILQVIPDERSRRIDRAQAVMRRIGSKLIEEKKAEIRRESASEGKEKDAGLERKNVRGRDLLTLLLKANMATDIPDSQKLSDEDVLAQVPTFLIAGHETTSVAATWCLFALTQAPEVQHKLREELWTLETDTPTMDELSSLPYLDAVVRETLRIHAPVPSTVRTAMKDEVLPLSEPFVDRHGQVQDSIRVLKDTPIFIPILSLNRSKKLWGEDAYEFKPERWENPPEEISNIPGVWGHLLSFLGGPRACIGYRFALIEMKAIIYTLVRAFEFELAVPLADIQKKSVPPRPVLRSQPEAGGQLPLLVRPYRRG
ncbi:cytochrome P450 [Earliella scabrosa]|nr:cytochrome P450 [Earliella scabrosa]